MPVRPLTASLTTPGYLRSQLWSHPRQWPISCLYDDTLLWFTSHNDTGFQEFAITCLLSTRWWLSYTICTSHTHQYVQDGDSNNASYRSVHNILLRVPKVSLTYCPTTGSRIAYANTIQNQDRLVLFWSPLMLSNNSHEKGGSKSIRHRKIRKSERMSRR